MAGDDIEYRLTALEEDSRRNQETHKEFFARFEKISNEHTRIDAQYANILATMAEMKAAIEEMRSKPAKRWDAVVGAIITGVVGFIVAWALRGGV